MSVFKMAALSPEEKVPSDEVLSFELIDKKQSPEEAASSEKEVQPEKRILETGLKGKVLWFSITRKYGFINRTDVDMEGYDQMDIFVHASKIVRNNPKTQYASLTEGQEVLFDLQEGGKCGEAINVTGLDGKPVKRPRRRRAQADQVKKESVEADHKIPRKRYGSVKKNSDDKDKQDSINDVATALSDVSLCDHKEEQEGNQPK